MAGEGGGVGAGDESGASSPKNKVKFLCSHGGKILPRPADGHLKYVGGESRVIAVPRDINFSELTKKLTVLIDGDIVLKYQLVHQDLDALVSVRTDEDLKHMFDEYDRHESGGSPMFRTFLFPSKPVILESQAPVSEPHLLEQRYIDAINGIIRTSPKARLSPIRAFSNSSACSSPKSNSPDGHTVDHMAQDSTSFNGSHYGRVQMHRVRSSPSISSLNSLHSPSHGFGSITTQQYDHSYYHHQNHHHHHPHAYPSFRPPLDPQLGVGIGRPLPASSLGKADMGRNSGFSYYYPTSGHPRGSGGGNKSGYHDESTAFGHVRPEGADSIPRVPRQTIWEL